MIMIIGSQHDDILYFESIMSDKRTETILDKYTVTIGTIFNQSVVLVDQVKTNYISSILTLHLIEKYYVLMVYAVGTCFAQNKDLQVGDIAISEYATFGDVDQIKMIKGTGLGQIPGYPQLFVSNKELINV